MAPNPPAPPSPRPSTRVARPPVCLLSPGLLLSLVLLLAPVLPTAAADGPWLVDVAAEAGVDFHHFNGRSGKLRFGEMMGTGIALLDFDGDGDLDLFLAQGAPLAGDTVDDALAEPPPGGWRLGDRLLRNDSAAGPDGRPVLAFTDVSERLGVEPATTMGVASGDVDGDGAPDLYLMRLGPDRLLRNTGDGRFEDVTAAAGLGDRRWTTSGAFVDLDRDGDQDLWVVAYVDYDLSDEPICYTPGGRRDYCGPAAFPPISDRLWENRGDGTFTDITTPALGRHEPGPGLGVATLDADGDGRLDVYVANDGEANQLWLSRGTVESGGRPVASLREEALLAGVALNRRGVAEAGMGVAADDLDADGDEDLFVTHLASETHTLYLNDGGALFEDRTAETGIGAPSLPFTGFGVVSLDADGDGRLDLLVANGAVRLQEDRLDAGDLFPLGQPDQLLRQGADGRFTDASAAAGPDLAHSSAGRAAAGGDLDNDGDLDAVIHNNGGPARVLENRGADGARFVTLLPLDGATGTVLLGTRVVVRRPGRAPWLQRSRTDGSYAAARDPRIVVPLGRGEAAVEALEITWPDGRSTVLGSPPLDRHLVVRRPAAPGPAASSSATPTSPAPEESP